MKKMISVVCHQVIRSRAKEIIGSKELINEIIDHGPTIETITRGIVKLMDGRILLNKVIHKSIYPNTKKVQTINLLTGQLS